MNDKYYAEWRVSDQWHPLADQPFGPSEYYKSKQRLWFDDSLRAPVKAESFDHDEFLDNIARTPAHAEIEFIEDK